MSNAKLQRELMGVQNWVMKWVQHEDASYSENSLFIWSRQGLARMFMMTWLIIGCGNMQHRPFENQHQRILAPKGTKQNEHGNMETLTAEPTDILSTNGEMPQICILIWRRWQNCFFSLTSHLLCVGHPCISERPHSHLRPYMSGQQKKRGRF